MQDPARNAPREDPADDATIDHHKSAETRPQSSSADAQLQGESWQLPGGRYHVVGEIARGGMGVVLRAIDADVQRPLAVKVMQGSVTADQQERFLEEGRITGQLQHPGIPPVHEIGRLEDGLPFFSMKLIEGHTLTELLRARETPQSDLPRFLMVFEQIAQTVAYAHSGGIIHRDLKPSNIMVGAFGEVQVMDWGLAKRLIEGPQTDAGGHEQSGTASNKPAAGGPKAKVTGALDETIESTPPTRGTGALTQAGQILGTPAYMPPEQALGKIDQLDQRADVFGLGAILCEILSGQPPYVAKDGTQVYRLARQAKLDGCFARLDACGADPELVHLTRRCLSPERDDRPRDAGVVSAVVTEYLESVQQRLKQTEIERAEAQTRAVEEQKRREVEQAKAQTERQKRRVTLALAASLLLLAAGGGVAGWWYQRDQARQALARAEMSARQDNLNREVSTVLQEAERLRRELHARLIDPRRVHVLLSDIDQWQRAIKAARTVWRRADTLAKSDPELLRKEVAARLRNLDQQLKADEQDFQLAKKLDTIRQETALAVGGNWNPAKAAAKYPVTFRQAGYDVETAEVEVVAKKIRESPIRYALVAALDHWAAFTNPSRILAFSQQADEPDPWRQRVRQKEVWEDPKAIQQLAEEVDLERQSPQILAVFASKLRAVNIDAAPLLRQALVHFPQDYNLHFALGNMAKDPLEKVGSFRAALAVRPDSTAAHCNLSNILTDMGDLEGAIAHCRKALDIHPNFVFIHVNMGRALKAKGDLEGAMASYQNALDIDPNFAEALYGLGKTLLKQGDLEGALKHFQKAVDTNPDDASSYVNLGDALRRKGDLQGAITHVRKGIELAPDNAAAHNNLGVLLSEKGDLVGAITHFRRAIEIDPNLVQAYCNLGHALKRKGDLQAAITHIQKAIDIDPQYAEAHYDLALALSAKGDLDGAIAANRQALALNPDYAEAHCNLGDLLKRQGKFVEALAAVKRGHELGSKRKGWRYPSAQWLAGAQRRVELDPKLTAVLRGEDAPADVSERLEMAVLLLYKKKYADSAQFYADAFKDEPKRADDLRSGYRYKAACAAALAIAEGGDNKLADEERQTWLKQARKWLEADLQAWTMALNRNHEAPPFIKRKLQHWQTVPDLTGIRDKPSLAKLPTVEQAAWQQLWADVRHLLGRLETKKE